MATTDKSCYSIIKKYGQVQIKNSSYGRLGHHQILEEKLSFEQESKGPVTLFCTHKTSV